MTERGIIPIAIRIDPPDWSAWKTPEGPWVAHCPPLGLAIECDSKEELQRDAENATDLLIADLIETGDWMEFFKERGIPFRILPLPPEVLAQVRVEREPTPSYGVPISLVIQNQSHGQPLRNSR